jgi:hypothetical protein
MQFIDINEVFILYDVGLSILYRWNFHLKFCI